MPTPWFNEYIQCEGSGGTLLLGSRAIWCGEHSDLFLSGPSRGSNLTIAGVNGELDRPRSRDGLSVSLQRVTIDGTFDQNNLAVAGARANCLALMRTLVDFFDESCTSRGFTLRLVEGTKEYVGTARLENVGAWTPIGPTVIETELDIRIAEGRLTRVPPPPPPPPL